jgi:hypothetical protein
MKLNGQHPTQTNNVCQETFLSSYHFLLIQRHRPVISANYNAQARPFNHADERAALLAAGARSGYS